MYIPAGSRLKDVKWATLTCPMTWAAQGAWPAQNDGTEVTAVDCAFQSRRPILAAGDNFGRIRLFRYPCTTSLAKSKEYRGHGPNITKVRWAGGDSHLVSCSASDRCVFQWAHVVDDLADQGTESTTKVSTTDSVSSPSALAERIDNIGVEPTEDEDEGEDVADKVHKRSWLLAAVPPSDAGKPNLEPPNLEVRLAWVHGCQTEATRSAVAYNDLDEIVYPVSKLAVVYSPAAHTQRYYFGHRHPIASLAVSADGRLAASGETAKRPLIHVWDARAACAAAKLGPYHRARVRALAFSPSADRLVSLGADNDGSLAVWASPGGEWHDAYLQAAVATSDRVVRFVAFSNPSKNEEHYDLMTAGDGHAYFWTLVGRGLAALEPLWPDDRPRPTTLCGAAVLDRFVTGTADGQLYAWKGRSCDKVIRAHEQAVESIHAAPGDAGFVTGGRDGFVKLWSAHLKHCRTFDMSEASIAPLELGVSSVRLGLVGGKVAKILVAALSAEIYEIARESGSITLYSEGHFRDELWAAEAHPADPDVYATAGDDQTIRCWSHSLRRLLRKAKLDGPVRALAWSPDGARLVAGMGGTVSGLRHPKDGVFLILDANSLEVRHEGRDSRHWIRCIKYSPDGAKIAVGSMDHKIYLYDAQTTQLLHKCTKHNAFVTRVDFTADSTFIQSDAADFEHLYHRTDDGSHVRLPSQLKDATWATWTCVFGWPVQGCWPALGGDKDRDPKVNVNAATASPDRTLIAAGDDLGEVRLYRYPSPRNARSLACAHSHAAAVAAVAFSAAGDALVTVGRQDRSVVVWRIARKEDDSP